MEKLTENQERILKKIGEIKYSPGFEMINCYRRENLIFFFNNDIKYEDSK